MSDLAFTIAIERLLDHEGGYVNNPKDPGGETKWGISKRSYPHLDIKNLTRTEAIEIYKRDFWDPFKGLLPKEFAFQFLDGAVNSGIGNATRWVQRAVGVASDGHVGPVTLGHLQAADKKDLVLLYNAERLEFMTKLVRWDEFGRGWARRIAQNLRYAAQDN